MKICIAIEKFDPSTGGAERYCWDLAHFLVGRGHQVAVICMRGVDPEERRIEVKRVKTIRFPQGLRHLSFAIAHWRMAKQMDDYLHFGVGNTFYMDIYQSHGGLHRAWFKRESLRLPAYRRVFMRFIKRLSLKDMVQRGLEWWIFRVTRPEIISISRMVGQDYMTWFDYPADKITLVPNGIDTAKFSPAKSAHAAEVRKQYGLSGDEFVFCFVAQNMILKGFRLLVEAVRDLNMPFKVLVVGPADQAAEKLASTCPGRFVFAGKVAGMDRIYPACDALVHPTYYDACSLVVLESLASGIPVITTTANGASMYLDQVSGIVIPPADVEALKSAMQSIMQFKPEEMPEHSFVDQDMVFGEVEKIMQKVKG